MHGGKQQYNTYTVGFLWTQWRYVCITAIQHTYGGFWLHLETMCKYCCPHREYPFSVPHRSRRIGMTLNLFPTCHPGWIHPRDGHPLRISRMEAVYGCGGYRYGQREGHRAAYGRWERDCWEMGWDPFSDGIFLSVLHVVRCEHVWSVHKHIQIVKLGEERRELRFRRWGVETYI